MSDASAKLCTPYQWLRRSSLPATHGLDHAMESLLSLRFPRIEGLLRRAHRDLLVTRGQASVCFVREIRERHPNLRPVLDVWLVLRVVQLR